MNVFTQFFLAHPLAWPLFVVVAAVTMLTLMIALAKVQPLVAFVVVAVCTALSLGVPMADIPKSVEKGMGDLLGSLTIVICVGAMFGKLIADSGAAQRIATFLIKLSGTKRMPLALAVTGFVAGIPLYYNVGFVLLVPLVFSFVYQTGRPAVVLAIPLVAGLSIAHGYLPPHPSPTALVATFGADIGKTLIYGIIVAIPTLLIAGPLFSRTLVNIQSNPSALFAPTMRREEELPGAFNSFATALLPVWLLSIATMLSLSPSENQSVNELVKFLGNPMIIMLLGFAAALCTLGLARGKNVSHLMGECASALRDVAPILLVIAGAGSLKQVLIDSGVANMLAAELVKVSVPPLVLAWFVTTILRTCLGSATVAGLTAAGLLAPLAHAPGVDPNLMVLAIGAGSLMCSHVNDSGFWLFKEYLGLSIKDTFRSWTAMETLVGILGLVFVLILDALR